MNLFEKERIRAVYYRIRQKDRFNLPSEPFRLALLADLHDHAFRDGGAQLLSLLEEARPAAVLSAGDLVTAREGKCRFAHAVRLIGQIAQRYPTYLADGNHELRMRELPQSYGGAYEKYRDGVERAGAQILYNRTVGLTVSGMRIALSGYGQPLCTYNRLRPVSLTKRDVEERLGRADETKYRLLLAHLPDAFEAYALWGADLTLSGHIHGGIIRLPFLGGVVGSGLVPFPKYDRGCFADGEHRMIVSAGLGGHSIPVRFLNPPELAVIEIGA